MLLSGNHKNIVKWRKERSQERTALRRPDLYARYQKKQAAFKMLSKKKREHIVFDQMLKLKKSIPFSVVNKQDTKRKKK